MTEETRAPVVKAARTQRVIANSVYNLVPQFWFLALAIVTTPFILGRLGVDAYGILSLVTIVAGYLAFLDLGLNIAIIRFVASHHARGETREVERVMQTALTVFLAIGAVAAIILIVATPTLASLVRVPPELHDDAVFAFRLGAVMFGMNLVLGVFSAVPRAFQRFEIVMGLSAVLGTAQILGTIVLLATGSGLRALMLWNCAVSATSLLAYRTVARRLLPDIRFRPRFHQATFSELVRFSGFVMLTNFTGVAGSHSEKLMLGSMAPIAQVTYYAVPFNLVWRVLAIVPSNLFAVLLPAFSALNLADDRDRIHDAYTRAFRFIFVAVAPASILLGVFGGDLLRLWISPEMGLNGGPVLAILSVAILINAPAWVSVTIGQSMGRPGLVAGSQFVSLFAMIGASLLLIPAGGATGAAWAWLISNALGIPCLIWSVNRYVLNLNTARMLSATIARPAVVALATLIAAYVLQPLVDGWISLALATFAVMAVYAPMAYRFAFDEKDRASIRAFTGGMRVPGAARKTA